MRIRARHYATQQPIDITFTGDVIDAVEPASGIPAEYEAQWIAPAFFDLQINGCHGHSFNSEKLTREQIREVVEVCHRHGIAELFPTLVTNGFEALRHGFATLRQAREQDARLGQALPGFHLEGPYISAEDGPRGAHPKQHVRAPDWDEFCRLQEAAGGMIRLLTLAPEQAGAIAFIERLVKSGVVVAIGHTGASGEQIRAAMAAGARLSTHLGNGSHAVLPRHENYIWEQLAADELWASLITDGHHLPPAVVKCLLRVKTPARTVLTCDASSLAGLPPGRYGEWGQEFEILPNNKITLAGTSYLAGSGAFTDLCVANAMAFAGVNLSEAVDMAGSNPRQLLQLPQRAIAAGQRADLVLLDHPRGEGLRVRATLVGGQAYMPVGMN
jgi:N-acetylglucosamine-6-phosphate deacetylase